MAITYDNSAASTIASGASSLTFSYTVTGSNPNLLVCAWVNNGPAPTGITYNGVAMTLVNSSVTGGAFETLYVYELAGPATGANNVVITLSGTATFIIGLAHSLSGAKQTAQPDANNTGTVTAGTSLTVATTTVADNAWLVGFCRNSANAQTPVAGTTARAQYNNALAIYDSGGAKSPPGSYSLGVTFTADNAGMCLVSISPFISAGGSSISSFCMASRHFIGTGIN